MISNDQIAVNVMTAYIEEKRIQLPVSNLSTMYFDILDIRLEQLNRKLHRSPQTPHDLALLKEGHRGAELFLWAIDKGDRKDVIAELSKILNLIAIEFFAEIEEIETQHPEMKAEFARDREEYRLQWNQLIRNDLQKDDKEEREQ